MEICFSTRSVLSTKIKSATILAQDLSNRSVLTLFHSFMLLTFFEVFLSFQFLELPLQAAACDGIKYTTSADNQEIVPGTFPIYFSFSIKMLVLKSHKLLYLFVDNTEV